MKTSIKGHIFAVTTITIWSSTFIVSKILLNQFTPLQILVVRYLLAILFLTLLYPKFKKPTSLKEEILFLFIGAALAFYFVFENTALQHTYSSNVSLIVATIPLLTGILSMVVYKTHFFTLKSIIGFILAYLGVFLIIINGSKFEGVEPIGDFLALGAAAMFAIYSVLMEKTSKDYHMIQLTRKVFLYGWMVLLFVVAVKGQPVTFEVINYRIVGSMLFLGVVASSLAFILWNNAIKAIGPVKTNQYIYLIPVVTTIMSAWVLKEKITYMTLVGTLLILMGLYLSEKSQE
ncbi:DMT family transporter [Petrocella sp. FN5]|uniref:DMT family transporter n=1 Tax=Petrocella sp. FN5 TaxID=3032002 RepID=UPI0023DA86F9|nr:DMT family transporter [Petrocella sp. FN5]MDF1617697.1 DMT family transporter [Petrocella sp. FN5]